MILTLEQAKQYIRLPNTVEASNFEPFIPDAEKKYLRQYLGSALLARLDAAPPTGDTATAFAELLNLTRRALARFTFLLASPSLDLNITEGGFAVTNSTTMAPASKDRVAKFDGSMESLGWDALDEVLKFLDENRSKFPEWTSSDAYKAFNTGFIRSAEVFQRFVDISSSRLKFFALRQAMDRVETVSVIPILGVTLAAALRVEVAAQTTAEPMDTIRLEAYAQALRCIAYQTASEEIDAEKYSRHAELFLSMLRDYLFINQSKFPELFPAGVVAVKVAPYENTQESGIFVFGG